MSKGRLLAGALGALVLLAGALYVKRQREIASFDNASAPRLEVPQQTPLKKAPLPEFPDSYWERLRDGEVVIVKDDFDEKGEGALTMVDVVQLALIEAPWEEVFDTIDDGERHPEFLPMLDRARLLERTGPPNGVKRILYRWEATVAVVDLLFETIVDSDRRTGVIQWTINPHGYNDVEHTEGHWWLYPIDEGENTLLVYWTIAKNKFPIPQWVERYSFEKNITEILANVRLRTLSGGKWRKGDPTDDLLTQR